MSNRETERPSLAALSRGGSGRSPEDRGVPRPAFRWVTRVLLPLALLGAMAGMLLYSARNALRETVAVRVVPVVAVADAEGSSDDGGHDAGVRRVIAQAPGWIEPSPYAIGVPALADGVVSEVLVLEGQRVEAGQVVATLIDTDARIALRRAEAGLAEAAAAVASATAGAEAASARRAQVRDELDRKRPLASSGAVGAAEMAQLELRFQAAEHEWASAKAAIALAEAAAAGRAVDRDRAALELERMRIVSPAGGVVLSRGIEPGMRLNMTSAGGGRGGGPEPGVIRLYDPKKLQARVEVPLADAGRIAPGLEAEVTSESLPDRVFEGEVVVIVHEANIQRNTVQFKVAIREPDAVLKPEMLCRVKFVGRTTGEAAAGGGGVAESARLVAPLGVLLGRTGDRASVWVVDQSASPAVAAMREVGIGAERAGGVVEITSGLRAGERLIVDPPAGLSAGTRVKVADESTGGKEGQASR